MKSDVVYKKCADIVKIDHREDQYLTIAPTQCDSYYFDTFPSTDNNLKHY